ncbi:DE-cadherin [Aphelenchoides fujianensis]|nr:DE-cadherin [Aphelenchoides fujianensis]
MPSGSDGRAEERRRKGQTTCPWSLLLAFFLLLNAQAEAQTTRRRSCSFPETASQSFFFDFDADTPAGTTIVNSVVSPPDARLTIGNVRSNNQKSNFADLFQLRSAPDGRFVINTIRSLALPPFPSTLNETILYVTVVCNGSPHPLMTVRVRNRNSFAPVFLNEPYEIFVPQDVKVGAVINTPVVAIDEDPSAVFTVVYELAGAGPKSEFAIAADAQEPADLQALPADFAARRYAREQMPLAAALRVRQPLRKKIYYLNVTATDGQQPPRRSSTLLKVVVGQAAEITPHFSQREYYANFSTLWAEDTELVMNQPIIAYFPERSLWSNRRTSGQSAEDVRYELVPSEYSRLFGLNSQTARLYLKVRPYEEVPSTIELGIRAFVLSNPDATIESKIVLNDVSEVKLTYFAQCHYDVHLPENSPPNTRVTKFVVRGDIAGIDLLNGTEYFDWSPWRKNARIDYEQLDEIVVKAKLRSSTALHPKSLELCQIATIDVKVEDENDHSPRFPKAMFTFYTEDEKPYNNTEIGTIRATDEDRGRFGKVEYRILQDPSTPVPFTLFQSDGAATLYFTQPDHDFYPERSTSRVTIRVLLQPKPEGSSESEEADDQKTPSTTKKTTVESTSTAAPTTESAPAVPPMKSSKFVKKSRKQPHRTLGVVNVDGADGEQNPLESRRRPRSGAEEHEQETNEEEAETTPSGGDPPEEFESRHYNFTLDGPLDAGQFIGAIRLRQDGEEADGAADKPPVEYVAEEGIRGFVRVDPVYGTIRVDSKLIDDSYEQIRFAAQAVRKGRIVH